MKKSALLKECTHHEIALLGVPEMYRVKLAFLAGFRFAVEPPCQKILRKHQNTQERPREFYEAQACIQQISSAEGEIFEDIRQVLGFPAACAFTRATKKLHTFGAFDAEWTNTVNEHIRNAQALRAATSSQSPNISPQLVASAEATSSPATAESQQSEVKPEPATKGSDDCECPMCTVRRIITKALDGKKSQSAA